MDIEILREERLRAWCARLTMPEGGTEALVDTARAIQGDEELMQIFTAFHEKTALRGEWHQEWSPLPMDERVTARLGDGTSRFYLLAYMAALPYAERAYRRMGIPMEIFNHTMTDLNIWYQHEYDLHGQWIFKQFEWIWRHVACKLYRLGRLQFMLLPFPGKVTAFRNRGSGRVILLGDPTMPLREDGNASGAGGKPPEVDPWYAEFEETPAGWRGNSITAQGSTLHQKIFLLRSEWQPVLKHGETVLDLHIPRGVKMTEASCRESFQQAYQFFPEFFPDQPAKGVYCHTWFFTPQLQQILPPESNIVRFQREFYLYPHPGSPQFLWNFVFGEKYPDVTTAPRDTELRNSVLDWLEQDNELFDLPGVMLHAPDEWGTQPYYK